MHTTQLLDHFRNPRNAGELGPPAITVEVENPACGDVMRLSAVAADGRIERVAYKVRGCTASIAAGSALTEWMTGKTRSELAGFDPGVIDRELGGLPAHSRHAVALCADALRLLLQMAP